MACVEIWWPLIGQFTLTDATQIVSSKLVKLRPSGRVRKDNRKYTPNLQFVIQLCCLHVRFQLNLFSSLLLRRSYKTRLNDPSYGIKFWTDLIIPFWTETESVVITRPVAGIICNTESILKISDLTTEIIW